MVDEQNQINKNFEHKFEQLTQRIDLIESSLTTIRNDVNQIKILLQNRPVNLISGNDFEAILASEGG